MRRSYIAELGSSSASNGIYRSTTELPGTTPDEVRYPHPGGGEVYVFTKTGQHLRTEDAVTHMVKYGFLYDSAGQLTKVFDANADTTSIARTGQDITITAPRGQQTALTLDGSGFLATARSPKGEQYSMTYSPPSGGLLRTLTSPRQNTWTYTFGAVDGRLDFDQDPAGGSNNLTLGYAGGLQDRTTGLVRFGARDYEPATGRWTCKDPIGLTGGTNLYTHCLGQPGDLVDPEGTGPRRPGRPARRDPGAEADRGHVYNCKQTQEIIEWAKGEAELPYFEALYHGVDHHGGGGVFDFYLNEPNAAFTVGGRSLSAGQFGNYLAGYTGETLGPIGYAGIRVGGIGYALAKYLAGAGGTPFDVDSVPDIDAGARQADRERRSNGRGECGCP